MYNKKQKTEYINYRQSKMNGTDIASVLKRYFAKTEMFEEKLNKDLYAFNTDEILLLYKSFNSTSLETLMYINSQFQIYAVEQNGNDDAFRQITYEQLKQCVIWESDYITRSELLEKINTLKNSGDKFIVLALYEGICGNMMKYLSMFSEDNIADNNTFIFKTNNNIKKFKVSDELYRIAKQAVNDYEYHSDSRSLNFNKNDKRALKIMNNANYSPGSENDIARYHNLANRLLRIKRELNLNFINRTGLLENGRLNLIKEIMIQQNISNPREAILDKNSKQHIEELYGEFQSVKRFLLKYENIIMRMVKDELSNST